MIARLRTLVREQPAPMCLLLAIALFAAWEFVLVLRRAPLAAMVPALELMGVTVAVPVVLRMRRGRCDMFDPVMFAAQFAFLPGFIFGGSVLAAGLARPWFQRLISSPAHAYALGLLLAVLGFAALEVGFEIPLATRLGQRLERSLPQWPWTASAVAIPALLMLAAGAAFLLVGFRVGLIGSQFVSEAGRFDAFIAYCGQVSMVAVFLLWLIVFRTDRPTWVAVGLSIVLVVAMALNTFIAGNRGTPLVHSIAFGMAYWLSRRPVRLAHVLFYGGVVAASLAGGMLYGSIFREIKATNEIAAIRAQVNAPPAQTPTAPITTVREASAGSPSTTKMANGFSGYGEARVSLEEQAGLAGQAVEKISRRGVVGNATFLVERAALRLDYVSSVGVIVDKYKGVKEAEAALGLRNNIWLMTWTGLIPRAIWPNKPITANARAFGEIYLSYGRSSPLITPMADLLRNFGWIGVGAGMALLGFGLRVVYQALVHDQPPSLWRATADYAIVTHVSYEGFYGTLLPEGIRVGVLVAVCLAGIEVWRRAAMRFSAAT